MSIADSTQFLCFLALSAAVLLGALGVVLLPNIVYSAFLLGGCSWRWQGSTCCSMPALWRRPR